MTLREKAQNWIDGYKAGKVDEENQLPIEDWAAIISEYLHEADNELLKEKDALKKRVEEHELQVKILQSRIIRLESQNEALRFCVRCNGVSGAEIES